MNLTEWLNELNSFWAVEPHLKITLLYNKDWYVGLCDTNQHIMTIEGFQAKSLEEALEGFVNSIKGKKVYFHGYHSGSFEVPDNLVPDLSILNNIKVYKDWPYK